MTRLFFGLDLPPEVDSHLELMSSGVPGARWEGRDKFHLTLRYIGEVDGRVHREIVDAVTGLSSPPFEMTLKGIGIFPPRGAPTSSRRSTRISGAPARPTSPARGRSASAITSCSCRASPPRRRSRPPADG